MALVPEPKETALVVIDVQNDFCHPDGMMGKLGKNVESGALVTPRIAKLISYAKKASVPVLFVITQHDAVTDSPAWRGRILYDENKIICHTGSWGAELYQLAREDADYIIVKNRYSGFHGTNLDLILRSIGRKTLLFCGFTTNVCVETTLRDANSLDYFPALVADCAGAFTDEEHFSGVFNVEKYFGYVTSLQELKQFWGIED